MNTRQVKAGTADVSVVIRIVDSTDGTPETGVVFNTSGIDLQYRREGAASTAITEATLSALTDAHSDGGILHIGNGYYRLDLPDAACATGVTGVLVHGTVTGMIVMGTYVELTEFDPYGTASGAIPQLGIADKGTAQSATSTTLVLRAAATFADDTPVGMTLMAFGSTQGYWQSRIITDYVLSTDTATVDAWTVTPSGTITYVLWASAPASASSPPAVNVTHVAGAAVSTSTAQIGVNVIQAAGTAWGSGAITAGAIASSAITAAKFAADAIDSNALAATGTAEIATAVHETALTESYAADGATPTLAQALYLIQQYLTEKAVSGTTLTIKKLDGSTTAATLTLSDATSPTSATRAS